MLPWKGTTSPPFWYPFSPPPTASGMINSENLVNAARSRTPIPRGPRINGVGLPLRAIARLEGFLDDEVELTDDQVRRLNTAGNPEIRQAWLRSEERRGGEEG